MSCPVEIWTEVSLRAPLNDARRLRMTCNALHRHIQVPKSLRLRDLDEGLSLCKSVAKFKEFIPDPDSRGGFANINNVCIQFNYLDTCHSVWNKLCNTLISLKVLQLNVDTFSTESTKSWCRIAKLAGQLKECHTLRLLNATSVVCIPLRFQFKAHIDLQNGYDELSSVPSSFDSALHTWRTETS